MNEILQQLSTAARRAVSKSDWPTVYHCAEEILKHDAASAEGHFLSGMAKVARGRTDEAMLSFTKALDIDEGRYDAAVELARILSTERRFGEAAALLGRYEQLLNNSPLYLNLAGSVYSHIGLQEKSWPLYQRANELQPGVDKIEANLATTAVHLGKIEIAKQLLEARLERFPNHQNDHLSYARLEKATDRTHIDKMLNVLRTTALPPEENVFVYYALGKEFEDLGEWQEAFKYFKLAGDAVKLVADYDIKTDIALIDSVIDVCDAEWITDAETATKVQDERKTPIFVMGLPRTGTTLTERILSSHSKVRGVGETQFIQHVLRRLNNLETAERMTPEMIEKTARMDIDTIGNGYMEMLDYRLGDEPMFVDKLPFNVFYMGYIAKAFPDARLILMQRNPMDSCFSMYKQVFTWAFKFSYTLDELGEFYVAYDRLVKHWQQVLGDRLIVLDYEALVTDQDSETRRLLDAVGLEFEQGCIDFEKNTAPIATASSVQVREKIHARSVGRWKNYERELAPLRDYLEAAGISAE
jgi:tetratricopeptide (TPR) repeat protein